MEKEAETKKRNIGKIIILIAIGIFIYNIGFYCIQPIGALPQGITLIVWRNSNEPFFNSPDALSLKATGGVSLLSRAMAMKYAPYDRVIVKLPYFETIYLISTGGKTFSK